MSDEQWWYDLAKGRAVRDDERGPGQDVLGPYPSAAAAEAWRSSHEAREQDWEHEDERWEGDGPEQPA